jgi:mannose-6-phosphate isomerase-like protein (cupin superfamily)
MKTWTILAVLFTAAILMGADTATYISHDKVADALAKGGPLASTKAYTISGSHRNAAGQVEMHETETDILYVTDGDATFVTGGTMVGGKKTEAGQWRGSDITGGQTHHLTKGDVITIPAGMPHWFKEVPKSVSYFVVKVLKE